MRDGAILYADIFRPKAAGKFPAIVNISAVSERQGVGAAGRSRGKSQSLYDLGDHESAVVGAARLRFAYGSIRAAPENLPACRIRAAGRRRSTSTMRLNGPRGNRGAAATSGPRAFPTTRRRMAGGRPAAARVEGDHSLGRLGANCYRRTPPRFTGGISSSITWRPGTRRRWRITCSGHPQEYQPGRFPQRTAVPVHAAQPRHRLVGQRSGAMDKIKVPMLSAGNWSGHNLHLRGNTEGFVRAASKHKKLRIAYRHALPTRSIRKKDAGTSCGGSITG